MQFSSDTKANFGQHTQVKGKALSKTCPASDSSQIPDIPSYLQSSSSELMFEAFNIPLELTMCGVILRTKKRAMYLMTI